jgi:hypothetical protein
MDIRQAIKTIEVLSNLEISDETCLRALDDAINRIRSEALIQCDDSEVNAVRNA